MTPYIPFRSSSHLRARFASVKQMLTSLRHYKTTRRRLEGSATDSNAWRQPPLPSPSAGFVSTDESDRSHRPIRSYRYTAT
jgi:hypothetical protein